MVKRRSLIAAVGSLSLAGTAGCINTLSGGRFSGGSNAASLAGQRGDLVELYENALIERNDGVEVRNRGIEAFNEEGYDRAIGQFEAAIEHFELAEEGFSDAVALATDLGEDEAAEICETAREETEHQLAATRAGLDAALAARDESAAGDVNDHVEEYRTRVEEAELLDVADPQALADVLQDE